MAIGDSPHLVAGSFKSVLESFNNEIPGHGTAHMVIRATGDHNAMDFDGTSNYFSCKRILPHFFSVLSVVTC